MILGGKTPLRYYADFVGIPIVVATVVWLERAHWGWRYAGAVALGLLLFTFLEYWTHRVVLHHILWSRHHQRHHQHASEHVVFPWWYMPVTFGLAWCALALLSFVLILPGLFVGFMVGAMWFFSWHHVLHHWDLRRRPWLLAYSRWHDLHHKDLPVNYGITVPLWDFVFNSYCSTEDGNRILLAQSLARRKNK